MKSIKNFLAIAVLASAGATQAATVATFNVTENGSSSFTKQSLTGIGTLDSTGVLTISLAGTLDASALNWGVANVTTTNIFNGSILNGIFTPTGGQSAVNSCANNTTICGYLNSNLNAYANLSSWSGSVSVAGGGTVIGAVTSSGQTLTATDVLTPVSAVPVPAAAWLFGSGLLGLAGVTRRRTK